MPQVKRISSLSKICLSSICQNLERFCYGLDEQADGVDAIDLQERETNPFHQLPSNLLEVLVENAFLTRPTEVKCLPYLISKLMTPHLSTLNLPCSLENKELIDLTHFTVRLAAVRCKHLKKLRLEYYSYLYPDCLNFIPKFPNLQVLHISKFERISVTLSADNLFHLLGTHCKDLRELHARNNKLSDAGIHGLCVIGNCKLLRILDLVGNKVTIKGILMAVDNLPFLKLLHHKSILEGLACIGQTLSDQKVSNIPQYSLSALYVLKNTAYKSGSLGTSMLLCPYVTELYLTFSSEGIKDADLLSLLSHKTLHVLEIEHNICLSNRDGDDPLRFDEGLTFNGGILPLLKAFGKSLKVLKVEGFFLDIDVSAAVEFCPNLHSLILCKSYELVDFKRVEVERNKVKMEFPILKNLETLLLDGGLNSIDGDSFVSSKILSTLLASPLLSSVILAGCDNLTDEILQRANNLNSFVNLEQLRIRLCPSITKKGISAFLNESNPLQKIIASFCKKITRKDMAEWVAMTTEKNWQVCFLALYCGPE